MDPAPLTCTAFDQARRIASGSYVHVALAVKEYVRTHANASVLVFDDATCTQIDFDLRGSEEDIAARLLKRFPRGEDEQPRSPGRPRIGVVSREVTLLPRHWEWLADQSGGASVTLRKLVEDARRAALTDKVAATQVAGAHVSVHVRDCGQSYRTSRKPRVRSLPTTCCGSRKSSPTGLATCAATSSSSAPMTHQFPR